MGLSEEEVIAKRKAFGSNTLPSGKKNSFLKLLLESLSDPIIKILLIALAIKIVFIFKSFDWFETLGILVAVFLASFISSISEYGSEAAFSKLQQDSRSLKSKVMRSGKVIEIKAEELVVDDIMLLSSGDRITADGVIIDGQLNIDESLLNGETKETKKIAMIKSINEANKVYSGSIVYNGNAKVKVTTVGEKTLYGKIYQELQEKTPDSPLKIRLRDLAKVISRVGYVGALLASLSYLFMEIVVKNGYNYSLIMSTLTNIHELMDYLIYALTLSVTIIVVAVPEGLPMMITLVLSSNMKRMIKDNILVRKLVGIETAGSMNVLLTDKTGTLTMGKLKVIDFVTLDGKFYSRLKDVPNSLYQDVAINCYYNNESIVEDEKIIGGNITDQAIKRFVMTAKLDSYKIKHHEFFNSEKKYSSITINDKTYYKGAYEIFKNKCVKYKTLDGQEHSLGTTNSLDKQISKFTQMGYRVLVLVTKEHGYYTYIGLLRIKDEIRKEAAEGLLVIKKAGIHTIMITGDNIDTAKCIAKEVGFISSYHDLVLDSKSFNNMSDDEIKEQLYNIKVIARMLPHDKSRLVNIIKEMGLVVGMTGDGVNDAPALKKADIGFAMGSGTEVAKEASDIVILDDNIISIDKAILYGRTIFKSIRKFIIYQLSVNTCALIISIVGTLVGISNPITIVQMLWLNMIMDTFAGLAFSFEPPLLEYMEEPPKKKSEKIMNYYMYSEIIISGLFASILCILFLKIPFFVNMIRYSSDNKYLMTAYFAMFIFIGIVNAYNARTSRINVFANIIHNKVFLTIFTFITVIQIYIIYYGGQLFRTYGLTIKELLLVIILSLIAFPIDVLRKLYMKKKGFSIGV